MLAVPRNLENSAAGALKNVKQVFGQLVIGPPGAGKTTYCRKMAQFLKELDRKVRIARAGWI